MERGLAITVVVLLLTFGVLSGLAASENNFIDQHLLSVLQRNSAETDRVAWLEALFRDVTTLGNGIFITLLCLVLLGFLILVDHGRTALVFAISLILAAASMYILKNVFGRARPILLDSPLLQLDTFSFPSGHSLISAAVYPTLGALVAGVVSGRRLKAYCVSVAIVMTLLVGISRVYLGKHYPTDVLAGWCIGGCWSLVCWSILRKLQKRHVVETSPVLTSPDDDDDDD